VAELSDQRLYIGGPPLLTICGFVESVATLAFCSARSSMMRSSLVSLREKKCWAIHDVVIVYTAQGVAVRLRGCS